MKLQLILHPIQAGFGDIKDGYIRWTFDIPLETKLVILELPGMHPELHARLQDESYKSVSPALDRIEWYAIG